MLSQVFGSPVFLSPLSSKKSFFIWPYPFKHAFVLVEGPHCDLKDHFMDLMVVPNVFMGGLSTLQ